MIFTINSKKDKFLENEYNNAMKEFNKFFNINWKTNKPNVILVPDRKTINKLRGGRTESWSIGWVKNNDVYILDKKNLEKESTHKYSKEYYSSLLKHELAHAFTLIITHKRIKPYWLWEGIAICLSGQTKLWKKPKELKKFLEFDETYGKELYQESGFAIEFLVKKYGKSKLLKLIESTKNSNSKSKFENNFKKIYGFKPSYDKFRI